MKHIEVVEIQIIDPKSLGTRLLILITPPSPEDTLLKSQNLTERIMNTFLFLKIWRAKRAEKIVHFDPFQCENALKNGPERSKTGAQIGQKISQKQ